MRVVTFKIEEDLLELVDRYAIIHNMYRSEAIREAIKEFVMKQLKTETVPVAKVEKIKL
jgi:metal-responsive CopG/Arc/MetJ family transcriptional regulator